MNRDGTCIHVQIKGKAVSVSSVCIGDRTVIIQGRWLRTASVMDEELIEGDTVGDPLLFTSRLRSEANADLFSFAEKVPDITPRHSYYFEWDNAAVIPITTFSDWWQNRAEYDVRKAIKKSRKLGVVVKEATFDDAFVDGICSIYNESPVRQGRPFWHYQKDFELVRRENSTYLERSAFIGAYLNDELIGFIRMIYVGTVATTLQVISMKKHQDKKPTSALIAKAVEVCEAKGLSHFIYGKYIYNESHSSLTEFKRRNGFEKLLLPRYYVPLNARGEIALRLNLHRRWTERIPGPLLVQLRKVQTWLSTLKARSVQAA